MKIVKITEPREGFVYETECELVIYKQGDYRVYSKDGSYKESSWRCDLKGLFKNRLIGALNITHRIENGKLVEIPRRDIEVGDVFESNFRGDLFTIVTDNEDYTDHLWLDGATSRDTKYSGSKRPHTDLAKKIGIMGVDFEIDWSMTDENI